MGPDHPRPAYGADDPIPLLAATLHQYRHPAATDATPGLCRAKGSRTRKPTTTECNADEGYGPPTPTPNQGQRGSSHSQRLGTPTVQDQVLGWYAVCGTGFAGWIPSAAPGTEIPHILMPGKFWAPGPILI